MSRPIVVILNGPPGSGKDTIADTAVCLAGWKKFQFKDTLYELTAAYFQEDLDFVKFLCTTRALKEEKSEVFFGNTPREALIHVSEDIVKPTFGHDFFGRSVARDILASGAPVAILPDGGFEEETEALRKDCDVVVVRLTRDETSFVGDSRNYLKKHDIEVHNPEGNHMHAYERILAYVQTLR